MPPDGRPAAAGMTKNFNFNFQRQLQLQSSTWYEGIMLGGTWPKKVALASISQFCIVQEIFHFSLDQSREIFHGQNLASNF
jgi:hypothetical protein